MPTGKSGWISVFFFFNFHIEKLVFTSELKLFKVVSFFKKKEEKMS